MRKQELPAHGSSESFPPYKEVPCTLKEQTSAASPAAQAASAWPPSPAPRTRRGTAHSPAPDAAGRMPGRHGDRSAAAVRCYSASDGSTVHSRQLSLDCSPSQLSQPSPRHRSTQGGTDQGTIKCASQLQGNSKNIRIEKHSEQAQEEVPGRIWSSKNIRPGTVRKASSWNDLARAAAAPAGTSSSPTTSTPRTMSAKPCRSIGASGGSWHVPQGQWQGGSQGSFSSPGGLALAAACSKRHLQPAGVSLSEPHLGRRSKTRQEQGFELQTSSNFDEACMWAFDSATGVVNPELELETLLGSSERGCGSRAKAAGKPLWLDVKATGESRRRDQAVTPRSALKGASFSAGNSPPGMPGRIPKKSVTFNERVLVLEVSLDT